MPKKKILIVIFINCFLIFSVGIRAEEKDMTIYNFVRLSKDFCTGGQPRVQELTELKSTGIQSIVNLRRPSEFNEVAQVTEAKRLGFRYYNIPVNSQSPKDEEVEEFLKILSDPKNLPVFIHCASANRVGGFWMIRRVLVDDWGIKEAEAEALRVGMKSPLIKKFARSYIQKQMKIRNTRPK